VIIVTLWRTQQISINGDLEPQLFFFVLTHEIAHLITFSADRKILPHGKEWKTCYRNLLLESLDIYEEDFRPMVIAFSKTPKANYMATPEIVRYFSKNTIEDFIEIWTLAIFLNIKIRLLRSSK
jgi:hypothetical protein